MDDADLPRPGDAGIGGVEGMNRDQAGRRLGGNALPNQPLDGRVVGIVAERHAARLLFRRNSGITRNDGRFTDGGDQVQRVKRAVAVDHQAGNPRFHKRRVERTSHVAADRGRAGIPSDVAREVMAIETERGVFGGNMVRGVVANEQIAARAVAVRDPHWLRGQFRRVLRACHRRLSAPYRMIRI